MVVTYFLDTYAIVEIIKGNPLFTQYLSEKLFTSVFNLYELYVNILKADSEENAKREYFRFLEFVIPINQEHIFRAGKFKVAHLKKSISYTDALGYAIAEIEHMKFLTGDKEFKNFENVEFVK